MRLNSFETTVVQGTSVSIRDELLECQHPTETVGEDVHMDADYVFDASVDDNITETTRLWCKDVLRERPESLLFIFLP